MKYLLSLERRKKDPSDLMSDLRGEGTGPGGRKMPTIRMTKDGTINRFGVVETSRF